MSVAYFLGKEAIGDVQEDASCETRKKRPQRDIDAMPQRTKRQKCCDERVTSDSEELGDLFESSDQTEDTKETTDSDDHTEGITRCTLIRKCL